MTTQSEVAAQLTEELHRRVSRPVGELLTATAPQLAPLHQAIDEQSPIVARGLLSDDTHLATVTAQRIMDVLWPTASPEDTGWAAWWRTPLGRACAATMTDTPTAITHATAAAILGCPRGSIGTLVHRGTIARHPDGGVSRASVLARVAKG